jgi:hypothetical protein
MYTKPLYFALGLASTSAFAQGVDKSAANYKEGKFSDYLAVVDKAIDSSDQEDLPDGFDKNKFYKAVGIGNIDSYAQSSTPDGTEWVNKIQLNNGGQNEGFLKLLSSSKYKGFSAPQMAPAGSDLAAQLSLNLTSIESTMKEILAMGDDGELEEFEKGLGEEVPMLGVNSSDLLKQLDVRLNLVIDLDAKEKLQTPFGAFDRPHLTGRIDGISWIWEKVGAMAIGGTGLPFSKSDEGAVSTYTLPAEMAAQFMGFSPVVRVDKESDQIWLSTTPDFLAKCTSGKDTLADSEAFKATFKGLPTDGNSMTYTSKEFYDFFGNSIMGVLEQNGLLDAADEVTKAQLDNAKEQMGKVKTGTAQVISTNANGILLSQRGVQTIEEQIKDLSEAFDNAQKQVEESKAKAEEVKKMAEERQKEVEAATSE